MSNLESLPFFNVILATEYSIIQPRLRAIDRKISMDQPCPTFKIALWGDAGVGKVMDTVSFNVTKTVGCFANVLYMDLKKQTSWIRKILSATFEKEYKPTVGVAVHTIPVRTVSLCPLFKNLSCMAND